MLPRAHERIEQLLSTHNPGVPETAIEEIRRWARKKEEAVNRA